MSEDRMDRKEILKEVMQVVKWSNNLPLGADRDLCNSYPLFGKLVKKHEEKIAELMNKVLKSQSIVARIATGADEDIQHEYFSDCIDNIMEKVGLSIDDASGVKKNEMVVINASVNHALTRKSHAPMKNSSSFQLITARLVTRPQIHFKISNKNEPFVPKLTDKPNALRPLAILYEPNEIGGQYCHPYEFELEKFKPPTQFLAVRAPIEPKPLDATELVIVDNEVKLKLMMEDLEKQTEIAVDVEHHSYRSYLGLTSLLQISTRTVDYIVDSLALWDKLQCLNIVFTNPKVLKVLHGAERDIEWLQRDLGIYIVNMFDTYQAAKLLQMNRFSLAHLLDHYLKISVNKTYQLADWRIRPLPAEMLQYAREDTHYLLYVFDMMRNQLIERSVRENNLLSAVFESSRHVCLARYEKPRTHAESHLDLYRHSKKMFNLRQLAALKDLFLWRDKIARDEDESTGFVLPNHQLLQISEYLPREMQGLLACCNPVPTMVKQHLHTIHQIILKAREVSMDVGATASGLSRATSNMTMFFDPAENDEDGDEPVINEGDTDGGAGLSSRSNPVTTERTTAQTQQVPVQQKRSSFESRDMADDPLTCVHDFSHYDRSEEVPTLLNDDLVQAILASQPVRPVIKMKAKPDLPIFTSPSAKRPESEAPIIKQFVTPYARYVKYMDLAAAKEKEAKQKASIVPPVITQSLDDAIKQRLADEYMSLTASAPQPGKRKAPPIKTSTNESAVPVVDAKPAALSQEPLRNLVQKAKKKKQKDSAANGSSDPAQEPAVKVKGKKRKSEENGQGIDLKKPKVEEVEPVASFAYSNVDFSAFDQKVKRKTDFVKGRKNKKQGLGGHVQRHGAKSMTYTKKN